MGKAVTLTFTWHKVSQWLSKTIIPVALGVASIALAFALAKPELFGGAAAFLTPILEIFQKKAKDALAAEESNSDTTTATAAKVTSDVATTVVNDISAEAQAAYKSETEASDGTN